MARGSTLLGGFGLAVLLVLALLLAGFLGLRWLSVHGDRPVMIPSDPQASLPDAPRVVAMGTSLTTRYDWPAALETRLSDCLARPVTVTPVAGAGKTSDWGVGQIDRVLAARPDVVVMEFTINDADLRRKLSPAASRERHLQILGEIHGALPEARILLVGTNPTFGLRGLLRLRPGAYLDLYVDLALGDPRIGFLDLAPDWRARLETAERRAILPDGVHPDPEVARAVMVPALSAAIAPLWQQDCPDPG